MRISDWSSDVCSSDLQIAARKLGQVSALHSLPENVIAHRSKKPLESVVPTERSMKWNSNREASRMDSANMQMQVLEQPKATASRRPGWFAAGGVVGALLASTGCLEPLLLLMLGVAGAWMGNLTALEPYKPYAAAEIGRA